MNQPGGRSRLGALHAQRVFADVGLRYAPAAAAGAIAWSHLGGPADGALVAAATLLAAATLVPSRHPMHLTPISAASVRALVPVVGALIAGLVGLALEPIDALGLTLAVLGAWIVTALVAWIATRFETGLEARIAVIGPAEIAESLVRELNLTGTRGYRVVGWIDGDSEPAREGALGSLVELRATVKRERLDLLVQATEGSAVVASVADSCLGLEVRLIGANQLFEELFGHVPIATMNSAFFQYLMHPRYDGGSQGLKRLVDLLAGSLAALVLAPVMAIAAAAVKLGDDGPVLFRQVRVGRGGREFKIVKLRTMGVDAERDGARWSQAGDDRVTRVGRVLRRTHIDELPQLWNVLLGEMTLVGPRPEVPSIVAELEWQIPFYDRRGLVKPGITGWAQVRCGYAGSEAGTAWKLCHDLYYLKHRSLGLDLMVMLETVATAFRNVQFAVRAPDERFVLDAVREVEDAVPAA